jgi:hypothetical protein
MLQNSFSILIFNTQQLSAMQASTNKNDQELEYCNTFVHNNALIEATYNSQVLMG